MITYEKIINGLECYAEIYGQSDVVFTIKWTLVGTENNLNSSLTCATPVPYTAGQTFIPYSDLTKEQILAWIDEYTDTEMMQSYLNIVSNNIEKQKVIINPPLPWQPSLN